MRLSKKSVALFSFVLGATILTTSALADVFIGSGYYNLKNSAKNTAAKLTNEVDNFTIIASATVKVDDTLYTEDKSFAKYDMVNQQSETTSTNYQDGKSRESYYFRNKEQNISKDIETGAYHVYSNYNNYPSTKTEERKFLDNPFEKEQAEDAERIVDAFVGSLKDIIQIEESDDKKMYIGNLSDTQVPPLVNAISSYFVKYSIFDRYSYRSNEFKIPIPKSNIYVLDASGRAIENKDGILENVIGSLRVSAADEEGNEHIYSVELSFEIKDVNNTYVAKPDLEGEEVTYSKNGGLDEKHIGKYKNDIIKEQGNSFVKMGERYFEITSIENGNISGRYYEVYKDEYRPEKVRSIDFYSKESDQRFHEITFNYLDEDGLEKTGVIHRQNRQNIYVQFDVVMMENGGYSSSNYEEGFDNNFSMIFE